MPQDSYGWASFIAACTAIMAFVGGIIVCLAMPVIRGYAESATRKFLEDMKPRLELLYREMVEAEVKRVTQRMEEESQALTIQMALLRCEGIFAARRSGTGLDVGTWFLLEAAKHDRASPWAVMEKEPLATLDEKCARALDEAAQAARMRELCRAFCDYGIAHRQEGPVDRFYLNPVWRRAVERWKDGVA